MSDYPTSSSSKSYRKKVFKRTAAPHKLSEVENSYEKQADRKKAKVKAKEKIDVTSNEIVTDEEAKQLKLCEEMSVNTRTFPHLSLTERTSFLHEDTLDKSKLSDNIRTEIRSPATYQGSSAYRGNTDGIYSDWYPEDTRLSSIDSMLVEQSDRSPSSRTDKPNNDMHMNSNQRNARGPQNRQPESARTNSTSHRHPPERQQSGEESRTISGEPFPEVERVLPTPTSAEVVNTTGRTLRYSGNNLQVYTPVVNNDHKAVRRVSSNEASLLRGVNSKVVHSDTSHKRVEQPGGVILPLSHTDGKSTVVTTQPTEVSTCCGRMEITNTIFIKYLPCACSERPANTIDGHRLSQTNKHPSNVGIQTACTERVQPNLSSQYSKSVQSEEQHLINEQVSYADDGHSITVRALPKSVEAVDPMGRQVITTKTTTSIRSFYQPSELQASEIGPVLSAVDNDPQTISEVNDSDFMLVKNADDLLHSNYDEDDLPRPSYCCFRRRKKPPPTSATTSSLSTQQRVVPVRVQQEKITTSQHESAISNRSVVHTNQVETITELSNGKKTETYRKIEERREEIPISSLGPASSVSHCTTRAGTQQSLGYHPTRSDSDTEPPDVALFSYPSEQFNTPAPADTRSETRNPTQTIPTITTTTNTTAFHPIIIKRGASDLNTDDHYSEAQRRQQTSSSGQMLAPILTDREPASGCACQPCCRASEQSSVHVYHHHVYGTDSSPATATVQATGLPTPACTQATCVAMRQGYCQCSFYNGICRPAVPVFPPFGNYCFGAPLAPSCYCCSCSYPTAQFQAAQFQAFSPGCRHGSSRVLMA